MSREAYTAEQKIKALKKAKKGMQKYFKKWNTSLSVCNALPQDDVGSYLRYYINRKLLKNDAYVTSWVIRKVYRNIINAKHQTGEFGNDFWQKQYHLYRMRWVDHMINQLKEGQ